jgi:hypothetical protein
VLIALHGLENEQTVESLETLSSILFSMDQNDRAGKLLDAVIVLRCKIQGEKHRNTLASVASKVGQLHLLGRTSEAELLGSKLVEVCKESPTPDDAATLRAMSNLASIYTSKGDYANAVKLCNEVLQIRKRTLPHDDIDTVRSMVNLSGIYFGQERWLDASSLLESVLTIRRRTLGDGHPLTIQVARQLEYAYLKLERWKEIETVQLMILSSARKSHGEDHPIVQNAIESLILTYMENRAWKKATEMMERLLHIKKGVLPHDHSEALKLQSDLGLLLNKFPNGEYPMSDAASSIYLPLNHEARSIRLVSIKKGTQDSVLHANLLHVSLDNAPSYEALSYVWGEMRNPGRLTLNGLEMAITNNLEGTLLQLRSEMDDRLLWVDAICINQEDTKERSHQVQPMRVIYTTARRTLVWLGKGYGCQRSCDEVLGRARGTSFSQ